MLICVSIYNTLSAVVLGTLQYKITFFTRRAYAYKYHMLALIRLL